MYKNITSCKYSTQGFLECREGFVGCNSICQLEAESNACNKTCEIESDQTSAAKAKFKAHPTKPAPTNVWNHNIEVPTTMFDLSAIVWNGDDGMQYRAFGIGNCVGYAFDNDVESHVWMANKNKWVNGDPDSITQAVSFDVGYGNKIAGAWIAIMMGKPICLFKYELSICVNRNFDPDSFSLYGRKVGAEIFEKLHSVTNEPVFTTQEKDKTQLSGGKSILSGTRAYYISSAYNGFKYDAFVFIITKMRIIPNTNNFCTPCIAGLRLIEITS
jgi:hypothetical protein